jgi:penicillin amidase
LRTQPARWLPASYQNFDQLLLAAVEETVNDPAAPRKLEKWSRGAAFPLELQHPIFGQVPFVQYWAGPGRVEQSGGGLTVKQVGRSFGPSERMTVDFSDLDSSTLNIVTGQSGEIFSPHFMDQWNAWYNGTTFTLPFSENTVERAAQNRLELLPQQPQKN